LKRIAISGENDWRQYLLAECLESYTKLDETQSRQFNELLENERYKEAKPVMITSYERGIMEGVNRGKLEGKMEGKIEALRDMALLQMDARFGPLAASLQQRVGA